LAFDSHGSSRWHGAWRWAGRWNGCLTWRGDGWRSTISGLGLRGYRLGGITSDRFGRRRANKEGGDPLANVWREIRAADSRQRCFRYLLDANDRFGKQGGNPRMDFGHQGCTDRRLRRGAEIRCKSCPTARSADVVCRRLLRASLLVIGLLKRRRRTLDEIAGHRLNDDRRQSGTGDDDGRLRRWGLADGSAVR
jgi:hypothetical protein